MKSKSLKKVSLSDANLLLTITIVVFFLMYIGAMIFEGGRLNLPPLNEFPPSATARIASISISFAITE